jgi:hypothetical protein
MALVDRPDFQAWLERFEARHEQLHGSARQPRPGHCDGCGGRLPAPASSTGLCLVCLAEQYGRDRTRAGARIAGSLRAALAQNADTPIEDVREAVEQVLEDYERETAGRDGL